MRKIHYETFAGIKLPVANRVDDISSHEAKSGIIETTGGYIDGYSGYAPVTAKKITVTCDVVAENAYLLDDEVERWKALVGLKDKLYRRLGYTQQWAYARLMSVEAETDYKSSAKICEITMEYEIISAAWYGQEAEAWYFDAGKFLDTGLYLDANTIWTITVGAGTETEIGIANHGSIPSNEITLTIHNANTSIDLPAGLILRGDLYDIRINHAIPSRATVTIQAARKVAKITYYTEQTESIYKDIEILENHKSRSWLEFPAGYSPMYVCGAEDWEQSVSVRLIVTTDFIDKWR